MPVRLQRRRSKGWRLPAGVIYVGRPTPWGNPFHVTVDRRCVGPDGREFTVNGMRCLAPSPRLPPRWFLVEAFKGWILLPDQAGLVVRATAALAGSDLACWCPAGAPCHGDVWLATVNAAKP